MCFFYNWEELRDLSRPGSICYSYFCNEYCLGFEITNNIVTDMAIKHIKENYLDFSFLYLGYPDETGHTYGWMTDEYMTSINNSLENIDRIPKALSDDYNFIITPITAVMTGVMVRICRRI